MNNLIFVIIIMALSSAFLVWFVLRRVESPSHKFKSEYYAIVVLDKHNVEYGEGVVYIPRDRVLPPEAWAAISYLTTQWDYDWADG